MTEEDEWDGKVMRVGRKVGRTLYLHDEMDETKDGWIIGLVDTKELAAEITRRWNDDNKDYIEFLEETLRARERRIANLIEGKE